MTTGAGTSEAAVAADDERTELKRVIGPGLLLLFVIGDVLGTGIYALTGQVAGQVGGAVWAPFLVAFVVALLTACSYLELVTKYPRAAGAALYAHRAFGIHFLTFLVAFAVVCSGLTSASSAARAFAANAAAALGLEADEGSGTVLAVALGFLALVALVNLRGVSEGVRTNVALTCIELTGLLIIIGIGAWALLGGSGDTSQLTSFDPPGGTSGFTALTAATALAFFALVGFEDSVNMAEETKNPRRTFPRVLLAGLATAGVIYVLVAISATSLVSPEQLSEGDTPLLQVVEVGAPGFPLGLFALITMAAVANSALINMLMASRLVYGLARLEVLPAVLGRVLRGRRTPWVAVLLTTALAVALVSSADLTRLGATTSFLLLCVFTVVNISVLVLKRDHVEADHFRTPVVLPVLGAVTCAFLASPLSGRDPSVYPVAGVLMAVGIVLWAVTWVANRALRGKRTYLRDPDKLSG